MVTTDDQDTRRAAGVTTGASKRTRHISTGDDRHEHSRARGKART